MQCVYLLFLNYSFTLAVIYLGRHSEMEPFQCYTFVSSWRHDYKQDVIVWHFSLTCFIVDNIIFFPSKVLLFFFFVIV